MKRITVELNEESLKNAISELKRYENQVKKAFTDFFEELCLWIIKRANWYIQNSDLGELVKIKIMNAWQYEVNSKGAKIMNTANKIITHENNGVIVTEEYPLAAMVEFGVGVVGEQSPHPNAGLEGYDYDIVTPYKDGSGMWYFWTNHNELDIPKSSIEDIRGYDDFRGKDKEQGKRIIVGTRGTQGIMFAYNALVDAKIELADRHSELNKEWKSLLERYIK